VTVAEPLIFWVLLGSLLSCVMAMDALKLPMPGGVIIGPARFPLIDPLIRAVVGERAGKVGVRLPGNGQGPRGAAVGRCDRDGLEGLGAQHDGGCARRGRLHVERHKIVARVLIRQQRRVVLDRDQHVVRPLGIDEMPASDAVPPA